MTPLEDLLSPCAPEAEQAVLGSMLLSPTAVEKGLATLRADDFHLEAHRTLFMVMTEMHRSGEQIDILTLPAALRDRKLLAAVGGHEYVLALQGSVPTAVHLPDYAARVLRTAKRRHLLQLLADGATMARDDECPDDVLCLLRSMVERAFDRFPVQVPDGITAAELQAMEFRELLWAVDGLVAEGMTLFVGPEKLGKSFLALQLGIAVAAGGVAFGTIPVEAGRVLYLGLEDGKRRLQRRMRLLMPPGEAWPEQLHIYDDWPRMDLGGREQLEAFLRQHPDTRLVVVDTLARVRPPRSRHGDPYSEDYAATRIFKDLADAHGCALVVIHHTNKGAKDDFVDAVSGTRGLGACADATIVLKRTRGQAGATLEVTGRDVEEKPRALSFNPHTGGWVLLGDAEQIQQSEEREEIAELLRATRRPLAPKEIAGELDKNRSTVRNLLAKMVRDGVVRVTERGLYSLTTVDSIDSVDRCSSVDSVDRNDSERERGQDSQVSPVALSTLSTVVLEGPPGANGFARHAPPPPTPLPPDSQPPGNPVPDSRERVCQLCGGELGDEPGITHAHCEAAQGAAAPAEVTP